MLLLRLIKQFVAKRLFDIIFSGMALLVLLPFFLVIAILIKISSKGSVFFIQKRVGKNDLDFNLLKFRTMKENSESLGLLTIGGRDPRVTKIGFYLRKFKLDELPQLINVFFGAMSIVGPRPEVRKYVNLYNQEQLKVLAIKPGITDYASLKYFEESELLAKSNNPEQTYIQEIMPRKLKINLEYIDKISVFEDLKIIFKTIVRIFFYFRTKI